MTHKKATRRVEDNSYLSRAMTSVRTLLRNILFPPSLDVATLETLSAPDLTRLFTPAPDPPFRFITSLFSYRDRRVQRLVWEIKYRGNHHLARTAARVMADHTIDQLADDALFSGIRNLALIPIPISPARERKRGFNQAELLGCELQKALPFHIPLQTKNLEKFRDTKSQTELKSRRKRKENMKNCFWVLEPEQIQGKDVILVDDVTTTGNTLNECRRVLKEAGARSIRAVTVAH